MSTLPGKIQVVNLPKITDTGEFDFIQKGQGLPFEPKRVFGRSMSQVEV